MNIGRVFLRVRKPLPDSSLLTPPRKTVTIKRMLSFLPATKKKTAFKKRGPAKKSSAKRKPTKKSREKLLSPGLQQTLLLIGLAGVTAVILLVSGAANQRLADQQAQGSNHVD